MNKILIMDSEQINRCITRIAHEILEKNKGAKKLALVGIKTRGVPIANRLKNIIYNIEKINIPIGALDITLYRDDFKMRIFQPEVKKTEIEFDVTDKIIILTDEVIYTGRTVRCALDALIDLGRPQAVQLATLIDRGLRELPIQPDYVGKIIPTSHYEEVKVSLKEVDGVDKVEIIKLKEPYREYVKHRNE